MAGGPDESQAENLFAQLLTYFLWPGSLMEINIIHFSEPDLKSSAIKHGAAPHLSLYVYDGVDAS